MIARKHILQIGAPRLQVNPHSIQVGEVIPICCQQPSSKTNEEEEDKKSCMSRHVALELMMTDTTMGAPATDSAAHIITLSTYHEELTVLLPSSPGKCLQVC